MLDDGLQGIPEPHEFDYKILEVGIFTFFWDKGLLFHQILKGPWHLKIKIHCKGNSIWKLENKNLDYYY